MMVKRWVLLAICAAVLAACNLPVASAPAETPAPAAATSLPSPTAAAPLLTENEVRNGTYHLPLYGKRVTLADGTYQGGEGTEQLRVVMLPQIARGDLDGDGLEDAAVLIGENGGGSGTFVSLFAILNVNGEAMQAAEVLIDDRPRIHGLTIQNGEITVDAFIHASDDVMVDPTLAVLETYRYDGMGLTLVQFDSGVRGGARRSIRIEAPVSGSEAGGSVNLRGSMPVGPFENNLRLRIYDSRGTIFYEGPFQVQSADIGAPAEFDQAVDLKMAPAGSRVRIELAELSMKDGSLMAMDSVEVLRAGD